MAHLKTPDKVRTVSEEHSDEPDNFRTKTPLSPLGEGVLVRVPVRASAGEGSAMELNWLEIQLGRQAEAGADALLSAWSGLTALAEATGSVQARRAAHHLREFAALLVALEVCEPMPHPVPQFTRERLAEALGVSLTEIATHIPPPQFDGGVNGFSAGIRVGLSRAKLLLSKSKRRQSGRRAS